MTEWHKIDDTTTYAETDDPRVVLLIRNDVEWDGPEGDDAAPAYEVVDGHLYLPGGDRPEARDRDVDIWEAYRITGSDPSAAGVECIEIDGMKKGSRFVIFDPRPSFWRTAETALTPAEYLEEDVNAWKALFRGDVWQIGYAIIPDRFTHDAPPALYPMTGRPHSVDGYSFWNEERIITWAAAEQATTDGEHVTPPTMATLDEAKALAERRQALEAAPAKLTALVAQYDALIEKCSTDDEMAEEAGEEFDMARFDLLDQIVAAARPIIEGNQS